MGNNTHKFDTEGFIPVPCLNCMVRLLSSFIISLIGRNVNILSVVYIFEKRIYASKTLASTISECAIVFNVLCVTSTCPFMIHSRSLWESHFLFYVLSIYLCLYWSWELVFFYSHARRGDIRKVNVHLVQKYFSQDCITDRISCSKREKRNMMKPISKRNSE